MLWDMARFHNYDIRSPYNREAALWAANQSTFLFPLDPRPLRDLRAALGRIEPETKSTPDPAPAPSAHSPRSDRELGAKEASGEPEGICILDLEIDLRPARPDRLRQASDEIFFLD
jgi:hypothetical protein